MTTYLLTWNPKKFDWKSLSTDASKVRRNGAKRDGWSCGNRRSIEDNSRFYLLKQGKEGRGFVASGRITSQPEEGRHYDPKLARMGKRQLYVDIVYEQLLGPEDPLLQRDELPAALRRKINWGIRCSGTKLDEDAANALSTIWQRHCKRCARR